MLSFLRPALRYTITASAMWLAACGSSSNGDTDSPVEPPPVIPALTEYTIDTDLINESSGLARSQRRDDLLWTLNDSGGATSLYGITTEGRHVVTLDVQGALANLDWEDLASYTHDGVAYLLIGDMGDNSAFRPVTTFYRIVEPEVTIGDAVQSLSVTVDRIYTQAYPDGPRDEEVPRLVDQDQQREAEDFVIATGEQYSVRQFVDAAAKEVGIAITWKGKGVDEKMARKAMDLAAAKLPIKTRFVIRDQQLGS